MSIRSDIAMIFALTCDEATRLLSDATERRLRWAERLALRLHVLICAACRQWRRHLRLLRKLFSLLSAETTAPDAPAQLGDDRRRRIADAVAKAIDEE